MLIGHLNYYAVSGNDPSLWWFFTKVRWTWLRALRRRGARLFFVDPRRTESAKTAGEHRFILREYSLPFLDQMISVVTASTLVAYCFYTLSPEVQAKLGTNGLPWTIPFVLYGIFRYLYLVYHRDEGGSPTRVFYTDRPLLIDVALWALVSILVLGGKLGGAP